MGARSECAPRRLGDPQPPGRGRFRPDRRGGVRSAVRRVVELQVRSRGPAASPLWLELRRAAVVADRNRGSISPPLAKGPAMSNLHGFDMFFIAVYFLILFGIAWWAARREKAVSSDYFLASRDVAWFAVGASLFASNIGSEHLVGLAGTGAGSGLAVGHFEWLACLILLLLGWLFVPFYLKSGVYTMPEFLEKRYNSAARSYFTWVSVIGYVLTKISVTLYAGGVVIRAVSGWKPSNHPDFPWTGIIFGAPILGIWYWCTDQHIVQRVLAAKNIKQARTGTIFAGYLKILPVFIFVLPGIVAVALFPEIRN